jgi:hypothetical protein
LVQNTKAGKKLPNAHKIYPMVANIPMT